MSKKHQTDRRNGERFVSEESGGSGEFDLSRGLSRLMQIYKKGRTDQDAGNKSCGLQKIQRQPLAQLRNYRSPNLPVPCEPPQEVNLQSSQKQKIFRKRKRFQQSKQKVYTEIQDFSKQNTLVEIKNVSKRQLEQVQRSESPPRMIRRTLELKEQRSVEIQPRKLTGRRSKQEPITNRFKIEEIREKRITEGYVQNMSLVRNPVKKMENCFYSDTIRGRMGKQNQDSVVVYPNIYIVCDGHGQNGKDVSEFVSLKLLKYVIAYRQRQKICKNLLINTFQRTNQDLECSGIDAELSGSTAVMVVWTQSTIFCANVGDSRAVLCRAGAVVNLSYDHKPDRNTERNRINRMGGTVRQVETQDGTLVGPMRLWNNQGTSPGLAVSRSYGDRVASMYGVICQPEITEIPVSPQDQFIVLGSDGFFEFFDSLDVIKYVKYLRRNRTDEKTICEMLAQQAKSRWGVCNGTDDISCILVFL